MAQINQISSGRIATKTAIGIGWWSGKASDIFSDSHVITEAVRTLSQPVYVLQDAIGRHVVTHHGEAVLSATKHGDMLPMIAFSAAISPSQLGDSGFCRDHGLRFPYMCGSMANGIASVEMVQAAFSNGLLASFGAAGLSVKEVSAAIDRLSRQLREGRCCFNLIFSPNEPGHEDALVDLYLERGVHLVEASAYMDLTPAVVRYRVNGIHRHQDGSIDTPNRIIAKASRVEIAKKWFSPPPATILKQLLEANYISYQEAELASHIPMAQDLTVEADSGGHTDNRQAITLLPTMIALRDRLQGQFRQPLRVGAAGGIATPVSAAAAFSMGAAYIVTGTINQACRESGSSDKVRQMLAEAEQADIAMAPAVDMFEMGVKLQVLKRGTMFAMRSNKLYQLYCSYDAIESIPQKERQMLEKSIFCIPLEQVWEKTSEFFLQRDIQQIERANQDKKHKMALIFRWYLGLSSRWANAGKADRQLDYQIWCGPAMGAFNEWTKDNWLAEPAKRSIITVAMNVLYGAALMTRINQLHTQGARLPSSALQVVPLELAAIEAYLL